MKEDKSKSIRLVKSESYDDEYEYTLIVANKGYSETIPFCSTYSYLTLEQVKELHSQLEGILKDEHGTEI